jgi:hypothetical protein
MKQWYPPHRMHASLTPRCGRILLVLICVSFLGVVSFAQKPKIKEIHTSSDRPLWRVELQSQGYPGNSADLQRQRNFANFDTISFISDTVLAATFITREDIPDLQRREDPNHLLPYRLHAIFLDTLTGKTVHTLDWPVESPRAGIFPRAAGGFLLVTAEKITSYSADWNQLKELSLSDLHSSTADPGGIAESPSNKTLVVQFLYANSALCLDILTDTLKFSPRSCSLADVFTASDNGILAPEKLPGGKELRESGPSGAFIQYGVAMPDAPPEFIIRVLNPDQARTAHTICSPCVGIPQFVSNEMLVMYSPTYMSVVDRTGKVRFTQDFSPTVEWIDELGRPVRPSANEERVAIASNKSNFPTASPFTDGNVNIEQANPNASGDEQRAEATKARNRAAKTSAVHMSTGDIPAEFPLDVQVYDLAAAQWIYTLEIKAEHLHQIWGLALSPSGNNLAIDSGGAIQVFALPK